MWIKNNWILYENPVDDLYFYFFTDVDFNSEDLYLSSLLIIWSENNCLLILNNLFHFLICFIFPFFIWNGLFNSNIQYVFLFRYNKISVSHHVAI